MNDEDPINILYYQCTNRGSFRIYASNARLDLYRLLELDFTDEKLALFFTELNGVVAFATLGDVVIGIAMVYDVEGIRFIQNLAVLPEFRRMGIARKLVSMLLLDARMMGAEEMFLASVEGNIAARKLYLSLGFKIYPMRALGEDLFRINLEDFVLPIHAYGSRIAMMSLPRD